MYEIRLRDDKYGVFNSADECLCVFRLLNVAADFVAYIQGVALDDDDKYFVDEDVKRYQTAIKKGGVT